VSGFWASAPWSGGFSCDFITAAPAQLLAHPQQAGEGVNALTREDLTTFDEAAFDLVQSQNSLMNIADKRTSCGIDGQPAANRVAMDAQQLGYFWRKLSQLPQRVAHLCIILYQNSY
jgi:hypothetical protein